jgi:hypothetical protein
MYATTALFAGLMLFFSFGFAALALYSYGSSLVGEVASGIILSIVSVAGALIGLWLISRKLTHVLPSPFFGQRPDISTIGGWVQSNPFGSVSVAFAVGWLCENLPSRAKLELTKHLDLKQFINLIEKELTLEKEKNEVP